MSKAIEYSNEVLREINKILSKKREMKEEQDMTEEEIEIYKQALNAKQNYLNKADERKKEKEEMIKMIENAQSKMLAFKQKKKGTGELGEVVGGKSKQKRYENCTLAELKSKAAKRNIKGYSTMNKADIIKKLRK